MNCRWNGAVGIGHSGWIESDPTGGRSDGEGMFTLKGYRTIDREYWGDESQYVFVWKGCTEERFHSAETFVFSLLDSSLSSFNDAHLATVYSHSGSYSTGRETTIVRSWRSVTCEYQKATYPLSTVLSFSCR